MLTLYITATDSPDVVDFWTQRPRVYLEHRRDWAFYQNCGFLMGIRRSAARCLLRGTGLKLPRHGSKRVVQAQVLCRRGMKKGR